MPILRKYNALFVHIPKNAGRSIESILFDDEAAPQGGRRNSMNRAAHLIQHTTRDKSAERVLVGTVDVSLASQHLTLSEIYLLGLLPADDLRQMTKFCVVRNPYERAISSVLHFGRRRFRDLFKLEDKLTPSSFTYALERWIDLEPPDHNVRAHRRPQAEYLPGPYQNMGKMDFILRFENLHDDFVKLCGAIGAPELSLPWVGRSKRAQSAYNELYTRESKGLVRRAFEVDFDVFKYPTGLDN